MSTSVQGVDARAYLKGFMGAILDMTSKDIRAIPDDKWHATYGGCTKSACEAAIDAIGTLAWTARALCGDAAAASESELAEQLKEECSTKDGAIAKLQSSGQAFMAGLSDASDEALNGIVTAPWGQDLPLFAVAQIAVSHTWYHDGQLNFVQMLLGDDKVHWRDE